jgi:hypothetical protein
MSVFLEKIKKSQFFSLGTKQLSVKRFITLAAFDEARLLVNQSNAQFTFLHFSLSI